VKRILAIYGQGDIFAFSNGRYRRFFTDVKKDWGDKAHVAEIEGGGHFWMDARSRELLLEAVKAFLV